MDRGGAIFDLRMNLVVAVLQFTTIIHIRCAHAEDRSPKRDGISFASNGAIGQRCVDGGSRNCAPEVAEEWIIYRARRTAQGGQFLAGQDPDTNAIAIGWVFRAARMEATRLAAIFNVDAEQDAAGFTPAFVAGVIADA